MHWLRGGVFLLLSAVEAAASGGLGCDASGEAAKFEFQAGVTRGMGGPTFNFRGVLEILDPNVAEDLRKTSFEDRHLAQYWLDGDELRLLLYHEREADGEFGSVQLTVRTNALSEPDEGTFGGTYEIEVFDVGDSGGEGMG